MNVYLLDDLIAAKWAGWGWKIYIPGVFGARQSAETKSFEFGNLFATFCVFLSSELVSALTAQRGSLHSFAFAENIFVIRSLRLVF